MRLFAALALSAAAAAAAEPVPGPYSGTLEAGPLFDKIMREQFNPDQLQEAIRDGLPPIQPNDFSLEKADINGDGAPEFFVVFNGQYGDLGRWCGNRGCDTLIYQTDGNDFKEISGQYLGHVDPRNDLTRNFYEGYLLMISHSGTSGFPTFSVIAFNPKSKQLEIAPNL